MNAVNDPTRNQSRTHTVRVDMAKVGVARFKNSVGTNRTFDNATPDWFLGWQIDRQNMLDISTSLIRLNKFVLIDLVAGSEVLGVSYDSLKNGSVLTSIFAEVQDQRPGVELQLTFNESAVVVTEYGKQFMLASNYHRIRLQLDRYFGVVRW